MTKVCSYHKIIINILNEYLCNPYAETANRCFGVTGMVITGVRDIRDRSQGRQGPEPGTSGTGTRDGKRMTADSLHVILVEDFGI